MAKQTAIYERHLTNAAEMVEYAGYMLPIRYKAGVIAEHMAVRERAGLFDVSHMGEVYIRGEDALRNVMNLITGDITKLGVGRIKYSLMCNETGGVVDDLLVYRMDDGYILVVNAANHDKDVEWIKSHLTGTVSAEDISKVTGQIALQGPMSADILSKVTAAQYIPQRYYSFVQHAKIDGRACLISRNGYTGEDGFEIYADQEDIGGIWDTLMQAGEQYGMVLCGLAARDTLRLEAAMPLYGHELSETINPYEADLGFCVSMKKENFIGKVALNACISPQRLRIGLILTDKGIARENCEVYSTDGKHVGYVTSGTHCPFLGKAVAMALVDTSEPSLTEVGTQLVIDVRGRKLNAKVVELPFYKRS